MVAASDAGVAGLAHFLRDLEFDRQAVAIPARHVGRAEAAQGFVFDDDVLENLVQRGADVDVAVGERRAVVQDEFLRARALGLDFRIKPGGFPFLQPLRFPRDQVGLHREIGARQIQCVFVVHAASQRRRKVNSGAGQCQRTGLPERTGPIKPKEDEFGISAGTLRPRVLA